MIKLNSIVEYREPFIDEIMDGKPMQYRVVELNDDRCFIEPVNINSSQTGRASQRPERG
jgi:hypothetical protein